MTKEAAIQDARAIAEIKQTDVHVIRDLRDNDYNWMWAEYYAQHGRATPHEIVATFHPEAR